MWLDVDNINGGVLESMAEAVENSSIVLICMNEQYKQSYYCRLGSYQSLPSYSFLSSFLVVLEAGMKREKFRKN